MLPVPSGHWLVCLVALSSCAVAVAEAAQVHLSGAHLVQQQNGTVGYYVPLHVRHGVLESPRRRKLLKHGAIAPVLGAVREGYFYAQLLLGTPPIAYSAIIDTGSSITYIPCSKCQHCGTHMATPFDPSQSSTARWLQCTDKQCQCGSPACSCRQDKCYYTRHYAEESSSEGWMVADKLHLAAPGSSGNGSGDGSRAVEVVFGCENAETGEIYRQRVDGVLGMGNNVNSLPRQLARAGAMEDVFSLCYGFPDGGSMLLGDVSVSPEPELLFTPFVPTRHNYYTVAIQGMSLRGKDLAVKPEDFRRGYGAVLDSGTTFTYLPTSAYRAFLAAVTAAIAGTSLQRASGADPSFNDVCWVGAPQDWDKVNKMFPTGNMTFAGGAFIELVPYRYLFKVSGGQYCLGVFDNGVQGTLLGGIITRNVIVKYDKVNNRAGFAHTDCNSIKPAAQAREINESPASSSSTQQETPTSPQQAQQHTDEASHVPATQQQQQQQQQPQQQQQGPKPGQQKVPAAAAAASEAGLPQASPEHPAALNRKLLWLGVAVGLVLSVAIVQLAFATLWQPAAGSSKGGSSGGLIPRALGAGGRPYQQVGTSDDQELAELSERGLLLQGTNSSAVSPSPVTQPQVVVSHLAEPEAAAQPTSTAPAMP